MTASRSLRPTRRGFTLVELMVACALVVLILTILAVAFGAATESLSRLRSTGNMAERLRTAQDKLREDLESPHFVAGDSPAPLKLSDLRYDLVGTALGSRITPPLGGYVRIEQGSGSTFEGTDPDVWSTRASNHVLEMTVQRSGQTPDELFSVTAPSAFPLSVSDTAVGTAQLSTYWARVRWELGNPQPNPVDPVNGPPMFTLYRSVRLITPQAGVALTAPELPLISHTSGNQTHDITALASPVVRQDADASLTFRPYQAGTQFHGDDIVLTNVLSFEVKPTWDAGPNVRAPRLTVPPAAVGGPIPDGVTGAALSNSDYPYDDLPAVLAGQNTTLAGRRVFDTWSNLNGWNTPGTATSLPLPIRITGVKIKVRVYDPKNQLTRQVTFVVPL